MCQGTNLDPITKKYNKPHSVTHVGDKMSNTRAPRQQTQSEHGSDWKYGAYQGAGSTDTRSQWDFSNAWKPYLPSHQLMWSPSEPSQWKDWSQKDY